MKYRLDEIYCPTCGQRGATTTGKQDAVDIPIASGAGRSTGQTVAVSTCKCGVTFAHSVKRERARQSA